MDIKEVPKQQSELYQKGIINTSIRCRVVLLRLANMKLKDSTDSSIIRQRNNDLIRLNEGYPSLLR